MTLQDAPKSLDMDCPLLLLQEAANLEQIHLLGGRDEPNQSSLYCLCNVCQLQMAIVACPFCYLTKRDKYKLISLDSKPKFLTI